MLKKELRFQAKLDTSEFDNSVKQMQNRLREVYTGADTMRQAISTQQRGAGMGLAAPATPAQQRQADEQSKRALQETDRFIKEQLRTQQRLSDIIDKKSKQQDELNKKLKEENLTLEQKKKLEEDIQRVARQRQRLEGAQAGVTGSVEDRMRQRESMINNMRLDQRLEARLADLGAAQGLQGKMGAFGALARTAAPIFGAGAAIGFGAMGMANQAVDYFGMMDYRMASNRAAAIAQNQGLANVASGRTVFETAFRPQRARAETTAEKATTLEKIKDIAIPALTIGLGIGAMALAAPIAAPIAAGAAALGATGVTAGGIAAGLGIAGAGTAAAGAISGGKKGIGYITGERQAELERMKAETLEAAYQTFKQESPALKLGAEDIERNYAQYRELQRAIGTDYSQFLKKGAAAGFTKEQSIESAMGVLGAGGSTRMAQESVLANQLARSANLTNAPQVLGILSGRLGGAEQTKNATISIMAEAVKLGLDKSEFAAEQRQFVQASAELVARSGAKTEAGAEEIAKRFGQFAQGADTMAGIQGARSAYDIQQRLTGQSTGFRGALQAAYIMRSPALSKLSRDQAYSLVNMPEEQVMAGGFEIEAMAKKAGFDISKPEELKKFQEEALKMKRQSITSRGTTDAQRDRLIKMAKERGYKSLPEAMKDVGFRTELGAYASSLTTDIGELVGAPSEIKERMAAGQLGLEGGISEEEAKKQAKAKAEKGPTTEMDEITAGVAADQKAILTLSDMAKKSMSDGAAASKQISDNIVAAAKKLEEALAKATSPSQAAEAYKQFTKETSPLINAPAAGPGSTR